ncbi:MAG: phosphopantetheine-binding protein [Planctomycetes bacterium]|nr:phosphopantetheine-binding protein [Planctomycetota bacterium]
MEQELSQLIVESLGLTDVTPEQIDPAAPLFGEGLGLDSIDALELAIAIHKRWGVKTRSDDAQNRAIFASVRALAAYVAERRAAEGAP